MGADVLAIPTMYAGVRFRSRLEARWAVFFNHLGIRWEYEPDAFDVCAKASDTGEVLSTHKYTPDFFFPDYAAFGEVKPDLGGHPNWWTPWAYEGAPHGQWAAMHGLVDASKMPIILMVGDPRQCAMPVIVPTEKHELSGYALEVLAHVEEDPREFRGAFVDPDFLVPFADTSKASYGKWFYGSDGSNWADGASIAALRYIF